MLKIPSAIRAGCSGKVAHQVWTLAHSAHEPTAAEQRWLLGSQWEEILLLLVHSVSTNQSCSHRAEGRAPGKGMGCVGSRVSF